MPLDLIAFGSVFLEVVFGHLDRLPRSGEEIYVDTFAFSVGGGALTAAATARQAGATAGISALFGDDLGSRLATLYAAHEGVDLAPSGRVTGPAGGVTVVLNYDGDRAFVSHLPPRPADESTEVERWCEVLQKFRPSWCWLHPAGPGTVELLHEAHNLGTQVALDVSPEDINRYPELVTACAREVDMFLPTEEELLLLTGSQDLRQAIQRAPSGSRRLVVKRGGAGAIAVEGSTATEVTEGLRDVVVVDRTGAGDAFAGAVIAALGRGAGFLEAVAAGNAAGSDAVARLGSVGELRPTDEEAPS